MWEGGVRGAACIWSPLIRNPGRVSKQMIQIEDWLPTLYAAIGETSTSIEANTDKAFILQVVHCLIYQKWTGKTFGKVLLLT